MVLSSGCGKCGWGWMGRDARVKFSTDGLELRIDGEPRDQPNPKNLDPSQLRWVNGLTSLINFVLKVV
jgi:hypothetical protein